jgi:hypothetical protein
MSQKSFSLFPFLSTLGKVQEGLFSFFFIGSAIASSADSLAFEERRREEGVQWTASAVSSDNDYRSEDQGNRR